VADKSAIPLQITICLVFEVLKTERSKRRK
jgi:hypothetical protein